ncbi:CLUMA_CG000647, isoform B [Clunio marinus]|uniref:CLUMA_CG000647, isoform B n=1 Tax=Clunio marinus TaxID=568069 RepID=A0A1J1HKQ1_9DIPT|nr:CLUMA_CG000647, isoform B [Clunio marinus]
MKVLAIVFFVAVAAVCAVPVDETNKQDNVDTVVVLEDDSSLDVADIDGGLVREKRQFGGYGGYGGRGGYGGYGRGGYGGIWRLRSWRIWRIWRIRTRWIRWIWIWPLNTKITISFISPCSFNKALSLQMLKQFSFY